MSLQSVALCKRFRAFLDGNSGALEAVLSNLDAHIFSMPISGGSAKCSACTDWHSNHLCVEVGANRACRPPLFPSRHALKLLKNILFFFFLKLLHFATVGTTSSRFLT